jgi:hypothetical protein
MKYMVSADLGQAGDPTAVCVTEMSLPVAGEISHPHPYEIRLSFMKALPPHEDYEEVAERLVTTVYSLGEGRDRLFGRGPATVGLALDCTGVGRGVRDMVERELRERALLLKGPKVRLYPIQVTSGRSVGRTGRFLNVPKRDLVHAGYTELRAGRMVFGDDVAGVREVNALARELKNFTMKLSESGHDRYEPWRSTDHDDRVDALCLNCWSWQWQRKESLS